MKLNYRIDPEIRAFLPPLTGDERARLEARLKRQGCPRGAIVVGKVKGDLILCDGHNSHDICVANEIELPPPRVIEFADLDALKEWMVDTQLSRRNLTDHWRSYFIGQEYLAARKPHGGIRTQVEGSSAHSAHLIVENQSESPAAAVIAEKRGVSEATVRRDAAFAEAVDALAEQQGPAAKQEALSGEVPKRAVVRAASMFCSRCQRTGPGKDCLACAEVREAAAVKPKSAPTPRKPKPGEAFDPKAIDAPLGQVVRGLHDFAKVHGKSDVWGEALKRLELFTLSWNTLKGPRP